MERIKLALAVTPFAVLSLAIFYIQGFWGQVGILAFPLLGFQELITYAAVPFFSVLLMSVFSFGLGGWGSETFRKPRNPIETELPLEERVSHLERRLLRAKDRVLRIVILLTILTAVLFYVGTPLAWFLGPSFFVIGLSLLGVTTQFYLKWISEKSFDWLCLALFCWSVSFGYGRGQAITVVLAKEPNAVVFLESAKENVKLLGKLGAYYFYLNSDNQIVSVPEQAIKRIEYITPRQVAECKFLCS